MFFALQSQRNERFPQHFELGQLVLNTDQGWHMAEHDDRVLIYKGYIDDRVLGHSLQDIQKHTGNFCVFEFDKQTGLVTMHTDIWRSFVCWFDPESGISNLFKSDHAVWVDSQISIDQDLALHETKFDVIGQVDDAPVSRESAINLIQGILMQKVQAFLAHNQLPIKVFCSGGIDSALVAALVLSQGASHERVLESRVCWDYFWCKNSCHITENFWGYRQIHHWLDACVLTSGAPGDEFMLRSPTTGNLWLMHHGLDIFDYITTGSCYHRSYFLQYQDLFRNQQDDPVIQDAVRLPRKDFLRYVCNIVANDCQHWHIGNTLTFTPLRDLDIFKIMARLNVADGLSQFLDSAISRAVIERIYPDVLSIVSDKKNTGEMLEHMDYWISK